MSFFILSALARAQERVRVRRIHFQICIIYDLHSCSCVWRILQIILARLHRRCNGAQHKEKSFSRKCVCTCIHRCGRQSCTCMRNTSIRCSILLYIFMYIYIVKRTVGILWASIFTFFVFVWLSHTRIMRTSRTPFRILQANSNSN